jgi:phosphatidylserine/phosphatidylglycerophosphate/cardiolipin synthase-like enzyme
MSKFSRIPFLVLLVLLLSSCALSVSHVADVSVGMTKENVIGALGQPDKTNVNGNWEFLNYRVMESGWLNWGSAPYTVVLRDGKVINSGKSAQMKSYFAKAAPDLFQGGAEAPLGATLGAHQPVTPATVFFSPHGGNTDTLVRHIDQTRQSLYVLANDFTSDPLAHALAKAASRGVKVEVIFDHTQQSAKAGKASLLAGSGARLYVNTKHARAHNNLIVMDGRTVATGAFSFKTGSEEKNAEDLLILHSPELAKQYLSEWQSLKGQTVAWSTPNKRHKARIKKVVQAPLAQEPILDL